MARGVNKTILIGNLGHDPSLKATADGTSVCKFNLATNEVYKDRQGNKQERTEWHKIVCWAGLADICAQYLRKGSSVYIEGSNRKRKWTNKDGTKGHETEIIARDVQFLDGAGPKASGQRLEEVGRPPSDDIPF